MTRACCRWRLLDSNRSLFFRHGACLSSALVFCCRVFSLRPFFILQRTTRSLAFFYSIARMDFPFFSVVIMFRARAPDFSRLFPRSQLQPPLSRAYPSRTRPLLKLPNLSSFSSATAVSVRFCFLRLKIPHSNTVGRLRIPRRLARIHHALHSSRCIPHFCSVSVFL